MNTNYELLNIDVEKLYVNPDNARFINAEEIPDEISAINAIIALNSEHVINMATDIAQDNLNPNELPIVLYNPDVGRYLVMDGNRRITSIKLMTQYADQINVFNLASSQKRELNSFKYSMKSIQCIVCKDEEYVNYLLEKIHTSKPGVSKSLWDPQAQDRHQVKSGVISRRLAIVKMLNTSIYTTSEIKSILYKDRWFSKLERFCNDKYISYFGIKFDSSNNILLYIEEKEVIKGLSQLMLDLQNNKADHIAQTEGVRLVYLANFPESKKPNLSNKNDPLIIFNLNQEIFIETDIKNEYEEVSYNIDLSKYMGVEYNFSYTNYDAKLENSNKESHSEDTEKKKDTNISNSDRIKQEEFGENGKNSDGKQEEIDSSNNQKQKQQMPKSNPNISLPKFFEDLIWTNIDVSNPDNQGVLLVSQEIVNMSKNNNYKKFPISATFLTRSLLEQVLIYNLKTFSSSSYKKLLQNHNNRTPALEKLISYFIKNSSNIFANNTNLERTFLSFANSLGTKHYLDMVIHNPHLVAANPDILDNIVSAGLKGYIQTILNT